MKIKIHNLGNRKNSFLFEFDEKGEIVYYRHTPNFFLECPLTNAQSLFYLQTHFYYFNLNLKLQDLL